MRTIILAGGKGTRLWPLSRENYPKQFVEFIKTESLFQLTLKRTLACFRSKDIFIVSSENYKFHIINQIEATENITKQAKEHLKKNIILEPHPKSTAVAVMLVMKSLEGTCKDDDIFFVLPSDHIIQPLGSFKRILKRAEKLAKANYLVIFGVKPKKPEPGFGYVLVDNKLDGGFRVKKFVEKPSLEELRRLLRKRVYWNAGIFSFKKKIFLEELKKHSPRIFKHYLQSYKSLIKNFSRIPADSIDYAIMQKTKNASLVEFKLRWSDLGSWESLLEFFSKREGNVNIGRAEFFKTQKSFTFSQDKLITLLGLKDVLVVESSDSILAMKKGFSDRVKKLVEILKKKHIPQLKESLTVYRPWGYYTILKEKKNYKVKEIGIYPKKFISLQKHKYRSEHWNVVEGKAEVTLGNRKIEVAKNKSIFVPKGIKHKIYNPTDKILIIIEVQIGTYLGEDDIKRYTSY